MTRYRLYAVRVFTFNWEESLTFYRDVVEFPLVYSDPTIGWAQFQLGESFIGLERCDPDDEEAQDLVGRFVATSIEVAKINGVYQELLNRGVEFTSTPTRQPWGGVLAHFKDPDGNVLTLLGTDDHA
ncbi:MAG: VOC family protein [Pseudomonadota bacterium]